MPIRLSVSTLKSRIRADNLAYGRADPIDHARVELSGLFALLNFKRTSFGTLEFPESRRDGIYDAICALRTAKVMRYRSTLNLILETTRYGNVRSVEIKSHYERVDFPCRVWCRKSADATEEEVEDAGGLSPRFAIEVCFDEENRWRPKNFFFGYHEAKTELPLTGQVASGPKRTTFKTFGSKTYYFLVPRGEFVYAPYGGLLGELAFPDPMSIAHIWFVKDSAGLHLAKWKHDADPSELPQPSATAAKLVTLERARALRQGRLPLVSMDDPRGDEAEPAST